MEETAKGWAVLLSIRAVHAANIYAGTKTVELRKSVPRHRWLSAEMCIQYGLADEYAEQDADLTAAAKQYQGARAAFQSRDISTLPAAMAAAISAVAGPQEPPKPQTPKASEAGCLNNILAAMIK